jgi:hypothetical protein
MFIKQGAKIVKRQRPEKWIAQFLSGKTEFLNRIPDSDPGRCACHMSPVYLSDGNFFDRFSKNPRRGAPVEGMRWSAGARGAVFFSP